MKIIDVQNVNEAVSKALPYLVAEGAPSGSRNGTVVVAPTPVMTVYRKPQERVLFSPYRDANPFFHLMESLWMLAGRNDLAWPQEFNKRFGEYSDNGKIVWGAYGWRWKEFFGFDQLAVIVEELQKNPSSRRCVLAMWNAFEDENLSVHSADLYVAVNGGKDVPCNTHAYFDIRDGALNMTVLCRSNDAIWGAYGANAVHFSFLHEYMAEQIGVKMGVYRQFSNNFHAYLDVYNSEALLAMASDAATSDLYRVYDLPIIPLGSKEPGWQEDLEHLLDSESYSLPINPSTFLGGVALPMLKAWRARKRGNHASALTYLQSMPYCDWQVAAVDWVKRRDVSNAA